MTYESDTARYLRLAEMMARGGQPRLADHFWALANGAVKPRLSLSPPYDKEREYKPPRDDPKRAKALRKRLNAQCETWEVAFYDWVADMDDGVVYEITEKGVAYLEERS